MNSNATPIKTVRYVVDGTNIVDRETGRLAKFAHAGVAQIGADWLNGPDATPEDYEWTEPTTSRATLPDAGILSQFKHRETTEEGYPESHEWVLTAHDGEHAHFIDYDYEAGWRVHPWVPADTMPVADFQTWAHHIRLLTAAVAILRGTYAASAAKGEADR